MILPSSSTTKGKLHGSRMDFLLKVKFIRRQCMMKRVDHEQELCHWCLHSLVFEVNPTFSNLFGGPLLVPEDTHA
jgi:hypothetical protein